MSKTQRELLILGGILIVLGGLLFLRFGTEEAPDSAEPAGTPAAGVPAGAAPERPLTRGEMQRLQAGGQPAAPDDPAPLLARFPIEMLDPALSDSAVAARIAAGGVPDPFAEDRGRRAPVRTSTTRTPTPPAQQEIRTVQLTDWPEGIRFEGIFQIAGSPGAFSTSFNGHRVLVGEKIPNTEWELIEASVLMVRIRRQTRNLIEEYRYLLRLSWQRLMSPASAHPYDRILLLSASKECACATGV